MPGRTLREYTDASARAQDPPEQGTVFGHEGKHSALPDRQETNIYLNAAVTVAAIVTSLTPSFSN